MWQLGTSTWAFAGPLRLVAAYALKGRWQLATIDLATGAFAPGATDLEPADSLAATHTHAVMVGGSARQPDGVLRVDLATGAVETIRAASTFQSAERDVSIAEAIEFATGEGLAAHAFFYPPQNSRFTAPAFLDSSGVRKTSVEYGREEPISRRGCLHAGPVQSNGPRQTVHAGEDRERSGDGRREIDKFVRDLKRV